jgi:hypothetical protein
MNLTNENGCLTLTAQDYSLEFLKDRPFVNIKNKNGERFAQIFVLSSVHSSTGRDDTTWMDSWEVQKTYNEIIIRRCAGSSIWQRKIYSFYCYPERFNYSMEIHGMGDLLEAQYFGGFHSAEPRWGSGFFWSGQNFKEGFTPEPNFTEDYHFEPGESASIGLTGVPLPGKGDWFFTPPPFCFCFKGKKNWLGMGVEAGPGENLYSEYSYHAKNNCFYLSLSYDGRTQVYGKYLLPKIGFDFSDGKYKVLAAHVKANNNNVRNLANPKHRMPNWWQEPIFCGWGEQCYLSAVEGGSAQDYSRQQLYDRFLSQLASQKISPGIVVLDDKWQQSYGENLVDKQKWPALPEFSRNQHSQGRKVLLWLKAWDPEGIPVGECITNAGGMPIGVDPTNPDYERRLRNSIVEMLSPDGYDADGFKIDFTARIPSSPGVKMHGNLWGLELMKKYLWIVYDETKKVKPDALIMTHTPHPYFADVVDMVRLNDINIDHDVNSAMARRAKVASIACPNALIDTDNWPMKNKAAWRKYLKLQPELGIPSLYFTSHIDKTLEVLNEKDFSLIRKVWDKHRRNLATQSNSECQNLRKKKKKFFSLNINWQPPWWDRIAP